MNKEEQFYDLLLQGILENVPFPELMQSVSLYFDIEIFFCDPTGRVLIGNSTNKFYNYFLNEAHASHISHLRAKSSLLVEAGEIDDRQYYFQTASRRQSQAVLLVLAYTSLEPGFPELAAEHLIQTYQYYRKNEVSQTAFSSSFTDLLTRELLLENDDTAEALIQRTSVMRQLVKPPYRILCFMPKAPSGDVEAAVSQLINRFSSTFSMVIDGYMFTFLYGKDAAPDIQTVIQTQLLQFCHQFGLACIVSSSFSLLSDRQIYISQVKSLLPLCFRLQPDRFLFYADDYYCEYMLLQTISHTEPGSLTLTAITYLEKEDRENGTKYLDTLECYLNNQMNAAAAARELYIDRTTLKYRLKKINDTIHVNIDDPKTSLALRLGLLYRKVEQIIYNT